MISIKKIEKEFKEQGQKRVSKKAKELVMQYLEKELSRIVKESIGFAKMDKKRTVLSRHVDEAIKQKTLM